MNNKKPEKEEKSKEQKQSYQVPQKMKLRYTKVLHNKKAPEGYTNYDA